MIEQCDWCGGPIKGESDTAFLCEADLDPTTDYIPLPAKEWRLHASCFDDVRQSIADREFPRGDA